MVGKITLETDVRSLERELIDPAPLVGIPDVECGRIGCLEPCETCIDVQSKHVNDATAAERGHLDPGYKMQTAFPRALRRFGVPGRCVVIGQRRNLNSRIRYHVNQSGRIEATITVVAVQMEIAEHVCATRSRGRRA